MAQKVWIPPGITGYPLPRTIAKSTGRPLGTPGGLSRSCCCWLIRPQGVVQCSVCEWPRAPSDGR